MGSLVAVVVLSSSSVLGAWMGWVGCVRFGFWDGPPVRLNGPLITLRDLKAAVQQQRVAGEAVRAGHIAVHQVHLQIDGIPTARRLLLAVLDRVEGDQRVADGPIPEHAARPNLHQ